MPVFQEELIDKKQTIARIFELCEKYAGDLKSISAEDNYELKPLADFSLISFFNFVKNIPYRRDVEPIEIVARPKIIIERAFNGAGKDCKKAAVLIGSYLTLAGRPWRLATVSTRPDKMIHHIFPQVKTDIEYKNLDATYSYMRPFEPKQCTKVEYYGVAGACNSSR